MNLIFLVSQPRAGSTALQLQLARKLGIPTANEPWIMLPLIGINKKGMLQGVYNHHLYERTFDEQFDAQMRIQLREAQRKFALAQYEILAKGKSVFLDKTPRYYEILPELAELFPEAYFILLIRNPLNVAKSILSTWCNDDSFRLTKYSRDILLAPILLNQFYDRYGSFRRTHVVYYEDIIENSEDCFKNISSFLKEVIYNLNPNPYFQLTGTFGDPVNAKEQNQLTSKLNERKIKSLSNKKLTRLLNAYENYMIKRELMSLYGRYEFNLKTCNSSMLFEALFVSKEVQ